jgi:predicted nucleotidyltransferase component of viral defense system
VTSHPPRYGSPAALRTALEEHLRQRANSTGTPLDRLRKEVAHQRLLARLVVVAPTGSWALKGGQALLARLGTQARATKDADATWRASLDHFGDVLEAAVDTDLDDGFRFEVAAPRPMTAETDEGGLRYPVLALLDGREFERIQLDVNAVPDDQRSLDRVELRDLLDFAGIAPPHVPVIPIAQHLAEKLHAYTREYGSQSNSRPRDLYDMLVIARFLPHPCPRELRAACRETFALRHTVWPPALPPPPTSWAAT